MSDDDSGELLAIEGFEMCDMYDGAVFRQQVPFFRMLSSDESELERAERNTIYQIGPKAFIKFILLRGCSFGAC